MAGWLESAGDVGDLGKNSGPFCPQPVSATKANSNSATPGRKIVMHFSLTVKKTEIICVQYSAQSGAERSLTSGQAVPLMPFDTLLRKLFHV